VLALGTGLGALAFGYQKYSVAQSRKDTSVAQENAQAAQFESLQEAIKINRQETIELRAAFHIMDRKLHVQQRTITRMEMLIRQFSGLVQQHGIDVPAYMQSELEALIDSDQDRSQTQ
jgi:uncharacterized protein HemX